MVWKQVKHQRKKQGLSELMQKEVFTGVLTMLLEKKLLLSTRESQNNRKKGPSIEVKSRTLLILISLILQTQDNINMHIQINEN